jgi:hypothetical protein
MNPSMVSGFGQYHTDDPGKDNRTPYASITRDKIREMVDNPPQVDKPQAQWLIPSTLPTRSHLRQEQEGQFWALWADLDKQPPNLDCIASYLAIVLDGADFGLYNTRSATQDNQKARIITFLDKPLSGSDWRLAQEQLNDRLEQQGIIPDRANERAGQLCYLPNRGEFYKSVSVREGKFFDPLVTWAQEIAAKRAKLEAEANALIELKRLTMAKKEAFKATGNQSIIEAFNDAVTVEELLIKAGYFQRGLSFRHPNSNSGSYSASINPETGRVHALSPNDPLYIEGSASGHDAFSAFVILNHSGDREAALRDAGDNWLMIGGESWNKVKRSKWAQERAKNEASATNTPEQSNIPRMT